jgi:hypothetical protein
MYLLSNKMQNNFYYDLDLDITWVLRDPSYLNSLDTKGESAWHWRIDKDLLIADIFVWLDRYNLTTNWAEIFYTAGRSNIFLHVDEISPANICKLNWVYDQGDTVMNWYNLKPGARISKMNNFVGGTYYGCDWSEVEHAAAHKIKRPTLVNAGVPHDVRNNSDYPRWCVSLALSDKTSQLRISFDEVLHRLTSQHPLSETT